MRGSKLLPALLLWTACSGEDSLGTKGGASSGSVTPTGPASFESAPACLRSDGKASETKPVIVNDSSLAGTWVGHLESYTAGDDRIQVVISEAAGTAVVVFGDRVPPPPPTSGKGAYPSDFPISAQSAPFVPYEGFRYTLRSLELDADRARFALASNELWRSWCPLQESFAHGGGCACLPDWSFQVSVSGCSMEVPTTKQLVPVFCAQIGLCLGQTCECSASGCRAREVEDVHFDLSSQSGELAGAMAGWWGQYTVRLKRAPI
ncbi:MAG: hypothetical protein IPM35_15550 [Myxococcales bacterium]|nr:hypothetical protein [Myxococcales bacterium]